MTALKQGQVTLGTAYCDPKIGGAGKTNSIQFGKHRETLLSPSSTTQTHACASENDQWAARNIASERLPGVLASSFDLLQLHRLNEARYPHFLESTARGGVQARYDILFAFPGETLILQADGRLTGVDQIERKRDKGFLSTFDRWWGRAMFPAPVTMKIGAIPPFTGGWFLYLGYELAREIEPTLNFPNAADNFPIAFATRFPAAVIRDHESGVVTLVAEAGEGATARRVTSWRGVLLAQGCCNN